MSGCLCCFAKDGGLLLYYRTYGGFDSLALPVVASLNSAHDYLANFQTELISCSSENDRYSWREYNDRWKFVLITRNTLPSTSSEDRDVSVLMDFLWRILLSNVGEKTLLDCKDVGVMKRLIGQSAGLIDAVVAGCLAESEPVLGIFLGKVSEFQKGFGFDKIQL